MLVIVNVVREDDDAFVVASPSIHRTFEHDCTAVARQPLSLNFFRHETGNSQQVFAFMVPLLDRWRWNFETTQVPAGDD